MSEDKIEKMQKIIDKKNNEIEELRLLIKEYQWDEKETNKLMDGIDKKMETEEAEQAKSRTIVIALLVAIIVLLVAILPIGVYGTWIYYNGLQKIEYSKCLRDSFKNGNADFVYMLPCRHLGPLEKDLQFLKQKGEE